MMKITLQKDMGMCRLHKYTLRYHLNILQCVDRWYVYNFHQLIESYSTSEIIRFLLGLLPYQWEKNGDVPTIIHLLHELHESSWHPY